MTSTASGTDTLAGTTPMCVVMNPIDHPMGGGQGNQKAAAADITGEPWGNWQRIARAKHAGDRFIFERCRARKV